MKFCNEVDTVKILMGDQFVVNHVYTHLTILFRKHVITCFTIFRLSAFEKTAQDHRTKMQDMDQKLTILESNLNELNMRRKAIKEGVEKVSFLSKYIYFRVE